MSLLRRTGYRCFFPAVCLLAADTCRQTRSTVLWPGIALLCTAPALQAQEGPTELDRIVVVGTAPASSQQVDRSALPYTAHVVEREDLEGAQTQGVTDYLLRRIPGIQVSDIQGNQHLGDLTYRGFRASALLGAPQGLSVYVDGIRINEPFGDVVNWDLVPAFSIEKLELVSASNPSFGLNTLGGAISIRTATGATAPGLRLEAGAGSLGDRNADLSYGATKGPWSSYISASAMDEDGWRDASASYGGRVFLKVDRASSVGRWDLTLQAGRSDLVGNGLVPVYTFDDDGSAVPDLYFRRRAAVYTHPDRTRQWMTQVSSSMSRLLASGWRLGGTLHLRRSHRETINGDVNDEAESDALASLNSAQSRQQGGGASLALSGETARHRWQVGGTLDSSDVEHRQAEQEGVFTRDRGVEPDEGTPTFSASVRGPAATWAVYATDTWQIGPATHVTASVRYNRTRTRNALATVDDDTGELRQQSEAFTYTSLNPALGLVHRLGPVEVFGNVARNTRVPTVIELGCADPAQPCRLPAGLQSDPFLEQVRSRTAELGARSRQSLPFDYAVAVYRTDNRNDILFRSVSATGQRGFFQNFPLTRYQGLDASAGFDRKRLALSLSYSLLDATYEATGLLRQGERNSVVAPGTRIAGLARHSVKIAADWRISDRLTLGGDAQAFSGRTALGDEDGRAANGDRVGTRLESPGFAVVNLHAQWQPYPGTGRWRAFARIGNLLDRRYETFAAVASTVFDANGDYAGLERDALFVAPGAGRSIFLGVRLGR